MSITVKEQLFFDDLHKQASSNGVLLYAGGLLHRAARRCPHIQALVCKDESITYQELHKQAQAIQHYLQKAGIKPRDRVIICFENSINFYRAYFGAWYAGAIVVPLNIFLHTAELTHIINDAQPSAIFCDDEKKEAFKEACADEQILITPASQLQQIPPIDHELDIVELERDEMAALLYTSGTTGLPKGVMLSSNNIIMNILQALARLQYTSSERVFGVLPLFHSFAQLATIWGAFFMCCTIILIPRIERRFIIEGLKHKPTVFLGVPALYGLLCMLRTLDFSDVKYFICGGDMLSDRIRAAFALIYRRKLVNGYGLSETSPFVCVDFDDVLAPSGDVGRSCIQEECEIRNEQGEQLAQGAIGELWIKGPNVMLGYYRAPEATNKVIVDDWFNTGDLAYITPTGRVVLVGRTKDLIINKGIKIYPSEIENIIAQHPNVVAVGVVGVAMAKGDEVPVAFVQLRTEDPQAEQALKSLCLNTLASYKVPRLFMCSTEKLAMTVTGKVDKKQLRLRTDHLNIKAV